MSEESKRARAEEVLRTFLAESNDGDEPAVDELVAQHPDLEDELRVLYAEWFSVAGLVDTDPDDSIPGGDYDAPLTDVVERLARTTPEEPRYELRGEVARGGMGAIIRVWDKTLRRTLAMKVALGTEDADKPGSTPAIDERTLGRFLDEAQVTGQLDHPGIVPVYELGVDSEGQAYFTMRLVKGQTLGDVFDRVREGEGEWTQTRALGVILKVCEAMAYAHSKGVIHRDLKPSNIMVGRFGEVYVMDWGLARVLGKKDGKDLRLQASMSTTRSVRTDLRDTPTDSPLVTMDGDVVGTPSYMSPEQARGDLDEMGPHSDVYALGATLYHLLAGHMPYAPLGKRVNAYAIWGQLQDGPPTPLPDDSPPELAAICEKAMARDASDRYPTTVEMAEDLRAFVEGRVVRAYRTGAGVELVKWIQRNRSLTATAAAAVLALIAGLVAALWLYEESQANLETARRNERRALDSERAAIEQKARADGEARAAREAREEVLEAAYLGNVRAANAAIESGEFGEAHRRLDSCPAELRGWEHGFLDLESDQALLVLSVPADSPSNVAWSPDGRTLASAHESGVIRLWDGHSGALVITLEEARSDSCSVSPHSCHLVWDSTGRRLAAARCYPSSARVWNARTGTLLTVLDSHGGPIEGIAWGPDDRLIAVYSENGAVGLWDAETGSDEGVLRGHDTTVTDVAWNSDGRLLATASEDRSVKVWDASSRQVLAEYPTDGGLSCDLAWSPDAATIAFHDAESRIQIRQVETGRPLWRSAEVSCSGLSWSPDGSRIGVPSGEQVRIWSTGNDAVEILLDGAEGMKWSPDGVLVATTALDDQVRIWDADTGELIASLEGHARRVRDISWSPDAQRLASASEDGTVRIWDRSGAGASTALRGHEKRVWFAEWSPDGRLLASMSHSGRIGIWDAEVGELVAAIGAGLERVTAFAWSPDGDRVAAAATDGIHVWQVSASHLHAVLETDVETVRDVAWSPDGSMLAAGGFGNDRVWVWDTASGLLRYDQEGHEDFVEDVEWSPDGTLLASASGDGTVRLWEAASGSTRLVLDGHAARIQRVAWSPDGSRLGTASSDGTARLWDARTGASLHVLQSHRSVLKDLEWSPDGSRLATASADESVQLWDGRTGERIATLLGHRRNVIAIAWSPDGTRLVSRSPDGTVRLWDGRTGEPLLALEWSWAVSSSRRANSWHPWRPPSGDQLACVDGNAVRVWHRTSETSRAHATSSAEDRSPARVVGELFEEHLLLDPVRSAIESREDLTGDQRASARLLAELRGDPSPLWLNQRAWELVSPRREQRGEESLGLRMARLAVDMAPKDPWFRDTLAWALLANGRSEEALAESQKAVDIAHDSEHPLEDELRDALDRIRASSDPKTKGNE